MLWKKISSTNILLTIAIVLFSINILTLLPTSEAVSKTKQINNSIEIKDATGVVRYQLKIDRVGNLVEKYNDQNGYTRIKNVINPGGGLLAEYGTKDNGIHFNVGVRGVKPKNKVTVEDSIGGVNVAGAVSSAFLSVSSSEANTKIALSASKSIGAMAAFGNINQDALVLGSGVNNTGLWLREAGKTRIEMSQAKGVGAAIGLNDRQGNLIFASAINDRTNSVKHVVKQHPALEVWDVISNAMTLRALLNYKK